MPRRALARSSRRADVVWTNLEPQSWRQLLHHVDQRLEFCAFAIMRSAGRFRTVIRDQDGSSACGTPSSPSPRSPYSGSARIASVWHSGRSSGRASTRRFTVREFDGAYHEFARCCSSTFYRAPGRSAWPVVPSSRMPDRTVRYPDSHHRRWSARRQTTSFEDLLPDAVAFQALLEPRFALPDGRGEEPSALVKRQRLKRPRDVVAEVGIMEAVPALAEHAQWPCRNTHGADRVPDADEIDPVFRGCESSGKCARNARRCASVRSCGGVR